MYDRDVCAANMQVSEKASWPLLPCMLTPPGWTLRKTLMKPHLTDTREQW